MKLLLIPKKYIHFEIIDKITYATINNDGRAIVLHRLIPAISDNTSELTKEMLWKLGVGNYPTAVTKHTKWHTCDTYDEKIGKEIAYLRLNRYYVKRLKVELKRAAYDISLLTKEKQYSLVEPWGRGSIQKTLDHIDRRLAYLTNVKPQPRLLSCPFCGSDDVEVSGMTIFNTSKWQVICKHCGAAGPGRDEMYTRIQAINAWNKTVKRK